MRALRQLRGFLAPYMLWAVLGPLLMIIEVGMDLMQPRLVQRIVDHGIAHHNAALVQNTGLFMILCALVGIIGGMGCTYYSTLAAQGFGTDLRQALFRKVQSLSFANLDELDTGSLITRLTNDVTQVQDMTMMMLRIFVRMPLLLVGSMVMAVLTSPFLALLFVVLIPVLALTIYGIVHFTYPLFRRLQACLDTVNTVMQENLSGVRVVKAFARSEREMERFGVANEALMRTNRASARLGATTLPLMMLTLNLGVVAALWLGGERVISGSMQVGQVIAFVNYLTQTLFALMFISMLIMRLSRAEASASRINEVLASEPAVVESAQPVTPPAPRGEVVFENVTFSYEADGADPVLKGISFRAAPGQTVAILGATGSGKSTLVNLIARFYDVTSGRVLVDGEDVRDMPMDEIRKRVSVALQEAVLFSGTIVDNIRYGRPGASEEEVNAAARAAQAEPFIQDLAEGYSTQLGQRGVNLSGGQKQRLAIARALLPRPSVLILDDSTSAVDVRTESRIQRALAESHAGQTRFVVAQRISAVVDADTILVLDDGELVACGSHAELLDSSPVYREIYESQMGMGVITDGAA